MKRSPVLHPVDGPIPALLPVFAALDEFLAQCGASPLGISQKEQTRLGVEHLKNGEVSL